MKRISMLIIAIVAIVSVGCAKKSTVTRLNNELAQKDQEIQRLQGELSTQKRMNEDLQIELMDLTEENSVLLEINDGLTHITLEGSATFASARAALTPASQNVLDRVWSVVGNYPDRWILVEGHADNQPINRDFMWKYQSNWELSSARAHSVLHYLLQAHRAEPGRIKVVGYGDQHPVADNESREGRQANRRVVITIGSRRDIEIRERSVSELSSSSGPDRNM